jgi:formylglycine-generating enzyme required for sulfatase activity
MVATTTTTAPVASTTTPRAEPLWFQRLGRERPPLPAGVVPAPSDGEYRNLADESVLLWIAPGEFRMGSDEGRRNERPVHRVKLSGYFIGKLEVTVAQYTRFCAATGRPPRPGTHVANLPASGNSWFDADAYCRWAGLALPTEAQWERAAGWDPALGRARVYAWGDEELGPGSPRVANVADETLLRVVPTTNPDRIFKGYDDGAANVCAVGSYPLGKSPCGALDMTGNISEWCQDWLDNDFYARSPLEDPLNETPGRSGARVLRGGNNAPFQAENTGDKWQPRVAFRQSRPPDRQSGGFRVCLPVK